VFSGVLDPMPTLLVPLVLGSPDTQKQVFAEKAAEFSEEKTANSL